MHSARLDTANVSSPSSPRRALAARARAVWPSLWSRRARCRSQYPWPRRPAPASTRGRAVDDAHLVGAPDPGRRYGVASELLLRRRRGRHDLRHRAGAELRRRAPHARALRERCPDQQVRCARPAPRGHEARRTWAPGSTSTPTPSRSSRVSSSTSRSRWQSSPTRRRVTTPAGSSRRSRPRPARTTRPSSSTAASAPRARCASAGHCVPASRSPTSRPRYDGTLNPVGKGTMHVTYTVRNTGNVRVTGNPTIEVKGPLGLLGDDAHERGDAGAAPANSLTFTADVEVFPAVHLDTSVEIEPRRTRDRDDFPAEVATASSSVGGWAIPWSLLVILVVIVLGVLLYLWNRRRRKREVDAKVQAAVAEALGDRAAADAATGPVGVTECRGTPAERQRVLLGRPADGRARDGEVGGADARCAPARDAGPGLRLVLGAPVRARLPTRSPSPRSPRPRAWPAPRSTTTSPTRRPSSSRSPTTRWTRCSATCGSSSTASTIPSTGCGSTSAPSCATSPRTTCRPGPHCAPCSRPSGYTAMHRHAETLELILYGILGEAAADGRSPPDGARRPDHRPRERLPRRRASCAISTAPSSRPPSPSTEDFVLRAVGLEP